MPTAKFTCAAEAKHAQIKQLLANSAPELGGLRHDRFASVPVRGRAFDSGACCERSCVGRMITKNKPLLYESLGIISRSFDQILLELEKLEELDCFRQHAPLKSAQLAVREVRS